MDEVKCWFHACSREDPGHGHWSEGSSLGGLGIMVMALAPSGKVCNLRVVLCAMAGHLQGSYPDLGNMPESKRLVVTAPQPLTPGSSIHFS